MQYFVLDPPGKLFRFDASVPEEAVWQKDGTWKPTDNVVSWWVVSGGRAGLDQVDKAAAEKQFPGSTEKS